MGAKGKYNKEIVKKITDMYKDCYKVADICKAVDIGETTYYDWLQNKPDFSKAIKSAYEKRNAKIKDIAILTIVQAMHDGQWTAAAWWLERKNKEEFAKMLGINMDTEEADKKLEKIAKAIKEEKNG